MGQVTNRKHHGEVPDSSKVNVDIRLPEILLIKLKQLQK